MAERDQRKSQRIAAELPMKLTLSSGECFVIKTWDFSNSGVFLETTPDILANARLDEHVQVQFQGTNFTPPVLSAKIIRLLPTGMALILETTIQEGDASHLRDEN